MAPYEDDDVPTLREMARTLRDFRDEFRNQMGMMVRKDVHAVEHENLMSRVVRIETAQVEQEKIRTATRNQYYLSLFGTGLSLAVALIVAAVK